MLAHANELINMTEKNDSGDARRILANLIVKILQMEKRLEVILKRPTEGKRMPDVDG